MSLVSGCDGDCQDCHIEPRPPRFGAFDDGTTLSVTACGDTSFAGCGNIPTTATIDGIVHDVPAWLGSGDDPVVDASYDRRLDVPHPASAHVSITNVETVDFDLHDAFAFTPPPSDVSRASDLVLAFEHLPRLVVAIELRTLCPGYTSPDVSQGTSTATGGTIAWSDLQGATCMHDLYVIQSSITDAPEITNARYVHAQFTSRP